VSPRQRVGLCHRATPRSAPTSTPSETGYPVSAVAGAAAARGYSPQQPGSPPAPTTGRRSRSAPPPTATSRPGPQRRHTGRLVVLVPGGEEALPDGKPDVTQAGNLTLKKLTKGESADWYRALVSGFLLATVKEVLAIAPGLASVHVVAVRSGRTDSYGRRLLEALVAARITRARLTGVRWHDSSASEIVVDAADELIVDPAPRTTALRPRDLNAHPDVGAALRVVDLDDLAP